MKIFYTTEEGGKFQPYEVSKSKIIMAVEGLSPHSILFPDDTIWDVVNGFRPNVTPGRFSEVEKAVSEREAV